MAGTYELSQAAQYQRFMQQQQQLPVARRGPGPIYSSSHNQAPTHAQYIDQRNTQAAAAMQQQQRPHHPQTHHPQQPHPQQHQAPQPPSMQQAFPMTQPYPGLATVHAPRKMLHDLGSDAERDVNTHVKDLARARSPKDLEMPEGLEDLIVGDGAQLYKRVRESEKWMDATILRKYAEYRETRLHPRTYMNCVSLAPGSQVGARCRKLRIWVSNTAKNQPWEEREMDESAFDFNSGIDSTYKVTIQGRLIDDSEEERLWEELGEIYPERYLSEQSTDDASDDEKDAEDGQTDAEDAKDATAHGEANRESAPDTDPEETKTIRPPAPCFSSFFKKISVEYDRPKELQPDGFVAVEWKKPDGSLRNARNASSQAEFDDLHFERKGDENMNVTIKLYRDESPETYKLDYWLAKICDSKQATREEVNYAVWEYIKYWGLPRDEATRKITCDDWFRNCFGKDTIYFPDIATLVEPHLSPADPIQIPYTIRVDPDHAKVGPTIYDVYVIAPTPFESIVERMLDTRKHKIKDLKRINALNKGGAAIVQQIKETKAKHEFYTSFTKDPVGFMQKFASSQKRDLEVILGDARAGTAQDWVGDEFRKGGSNGVWGSEAVRESVGLMVYKDKPSRQS